VRASLKEGLDPSRLSLQAANALQALPEEFARNFRLRSSISSEDGK